MRHSCVLHALCECMHAAHVHTRRITPPTHTHTTQHNIHMRRCLAGKETSKYTKDGPGTPGGQAWTVNWLTFDNSYFKVTKDPTDPELLVLPSDAVMFEDEGFRCVIH